MANYIVGGLIVVAVILALRSYFGKKYQGCCSGCEGCAYSQKCKERNKIKD